MREALSEMKGFGLIHRLGFQNYKRRKWGGVGALAGPRATSGRGFKQTGHCTGPHALNGGGLGRPTNYTDLQSVKDAQ